MPPVAHTAHTAHSADAGAPPEPFVATSSSLAIAGGVLHLATCLLAVVMEATRNDRHAHLREIAQRYRLTYSVGELCGSNDIKKHVGKDAPTDERLYSVVWKSLTVWLAMTGFFLFLAALIAQIEIFRAAELTAATFAVAAALVLCAAWLFLMRFVRVPRMSTPDYKSAIALSAAFFVLVGAWSLAIHACARTQAWTLPMEPRGVFVFAAIGFSLFAGWLTTAVMLSVGTTVSYFSSPDGNLPWPRTGIGENDLAYLYPPSILPNFMALLIATIAAIVPDPLLPVPLLCVLLLFTPRVFENVSAAGIAAVGCAVAAIRVVVLRTTA